MSETFTPEAIEAAHAETEHLSRELNITNADHIALWIERNTIPDEPMSQCASWLACRIVEAHEAAVADLTASLNRASEACASVQRERDAWKGALIDELIVDHIYMKVHEDDPKRALNDAIVWNVSVALDPAVSSDAAALVERGRQEVLRDAVELARFAWGYYQNPDINHVDYRVEVARKAEAFLSRYEGEVK